MMPPIQTDLMESSVVTPIELILGTGLMVMIAEYGNSNRKVMFAPDGRLLKRVFGISTQ